MSAAATSCSRGAVARAARNIDLRSVAGGRALAAVGTSAVKAFDHVSGRHLSVAGARLYFECQGDPRDPPLVLLHGGMGSLADFDAVLPLLDRAYYLVGIDSRGHGRSTLGAAGLGYGLLQSDVEQVLGHLKLARYSVMGFSDGGIVALRMAAERTSRIDRLVVIGTDWFLEKGEPVRERLASVTAEGWERKFPGSRATYEALNPEPDFGALVKAAVAMWVETGPCNYPGQAICRIDCPLLVVRGEDDPLTSKDKARALVDAVPKAEFLNIPSAAHVAQADQPESLMAGVNRFLTS